MATLNVKAARSTITTHEGATAKRINPVQQLRRSVMACMLWENEFYEDGVSIAARINDAVENVSLNDAAAIAIEAREDMHLRHAPLWIVRAMARRRGRIVGDTLARVIQRADELPEFLAMYWKDGRQPLSAQVKRGLAEAFTKFNAYALSKYNRDGAITLRDVLFMCHAKPKDAEQAALWKQLVDGTLPPADTWEVALSAGEDKKATWERLMAERKLGGLALLRNLRNMEQAGVPLDIVRQAIAENDFKRVLPFRFIAAARYAPMLEPELEAAMFRAVAEMTKLPGRTALLLDHSGSMQTNLSAKSDLLRTDAAAGIGMLLREICSDVTVIGFSTQATVLPARRGFALRDAYMTGSWGGTNTETAKQKADSIGYDRIIIITDEQSHQTLTNPLPGTRGYVVNVSSYRNGIGYGAWTHIDGFSEAVVRYIQQHEALDTPTAER
jgi:60 kDa SS-A/Ro ribonucleoprotein